MTFRKNDLFFRIVYKNIQKINLHGKKIFLTMKIFTCLLGKFVTQNKTPYFAH